MSGVVGLLPPTLSKYLKSKPASEVWFLKASSKFEITAISK